MIAMRLVDVVVPVCCLVHVADVAPKAAEANSATDATDAESSRVRVLVRMLIVRRA